MSDKPENPSAFPRSAPSLGDGMSLRDYFAGQVLAGLVCVMTEDDRDETDWTCEAADAYKAADAMLDRRGES